jgi:hypothetical protein
MVNTNMWHHPKYYKELRKRNKLDQVISKQQATASSTRAPGPGPKPQAASNKQQATSCSKDSNLPFQEEIQASSDKHQAPSNKHQAASRKRQAAQ